MNRASDHEVESRPDLHALAVLESHVAEALASGDESKLEVLGYGEISTVVALEASGRRWACKRLPPFPSDESLRAYRALFEEYLGALREAGVAPLASEIHVAPASSSLPIAYVVQPRLAAETLLPRVLHAADERAGVALLVCVIDGIERVTAAGRVGIDAQLSNFCRVGGELRYLDVSTPLLRDHSGRERLETDLFLAALPWALRGLVERLLVNEIVGKYYDARGATLDLLANLYKERLSRFVAPVLGAIGARFASPIEASEVQRYYARDARMWRALLAARRLDRAWQRRVRRRAYPFLLPGPIAR